MADNAADVSSSSSAGEQQQRHNAYSHDYRDQNGQGAQRDESKSLTELEREVLDEYVKLRENLDKVRSIPIIWHPPPPFFSLNMPAYRFARYDSPTLSKMERSIST